MRVWSGPEAVKTNVVQWNEKIIVSGERTRGIHLVRFLVLPEKKIAEELVGRFLRHLLLAIFLLVNCIQIKQEAIKILLNFIIQPIKISLWIICGFG